MLRLPPQTIMCVPVQTAAWLSRAEGARSIEVGCQAFVATS
jgi:hypothetical protein